MLCLSGFELYFVGCPWLVDSAIQRSNNRRLIA